ncbi:MAG: DUF6576 domain-containing protein [Ilumatobacteraceae bacterium]
MSDQFAAIFRRRPNDGWFRAGGYDVTTTDIVCALSVASMFLYGFSRTNFDRLGFVPFLVRDFEIWRVVTWPIATQPEIWSLLGIVFFWLFGQQLEALFGRGKFLAWVLALTIVPAVILTLLGPLDDSIDFMFQYGLSTLFLGGIWVYAATYPGVKWFEIIPLWALAAVFTVLNLLQYTGNDNTGLTIFLLVSVAAALVAGRSLGLATGWPIPHLPLEGGGSSGRTKKRKPAKPRRSSGSSGQRVVEGPWKNAPAPAPPSPGPSPADQIELDALLDKIGADGMDSLTSAEKQRLNDLSKRLRNR